MFVTKFRHTKNKKGITLIEMIAAIAITAILASVLSMMIVPVLNTYQANAARVELVQAATSRLNDIAMHLRGARGIYVSESTRDVSKQKEWANGSGNYFSNKNTDKMFKEGNYLFPEIRWYEKQDSESDTVKSRRVEFDGVRTVASPEKRIYSFVMDNYHERSNKGAVSGYYYPELVVGDWSNMQRRYLDYAGGFGIKLASDDYQSEEYWCPDNKSMYFLVRRNPDDSNRANVLEIHLTVKKGDVSYEGVKTIVCENLVIKKDIIYTNNFQSWSGDNLVKKAAAVNTGTDSSKWTKYYTVWFTKMV